MDLLSGWSHFILDDVLAAHPVATITLTLLGAAILWAVVAARDWIVSLLPWVRARREAEIRRSESVRSAAIELLSSIRKTSEARPVVVRVTDPDSDDLLNLYALHERLFKDEDIRDSLADFQGWIREGDNPDLETVRHLDDIMLALKLGEDVVGYLYAQYYINRHLIFLSYVGIDPDCKEAVRSGYGVRALLVDLLKVCDRPGNSWQAIVGEIEVTRSDERHHGTNMVSRFRMHAKALAAAVLSKAYLFRLDFPYRQPPLSPKFLRHESYTESTHQFLLYAVKDLSRLRRASDGSLWLPEAQAVDVFKTILLDMYAPSYPNAPEYGRRIHQIYDAWRPKLRGGVRLIPAPSR